jgi:Phosphatidylinositol 3- and 4-kinase
MSIGTATRREDGAIIAPYTVLGDRGEIGDGYRVLRPGDEQFAEWDAYLGQQSITKADYTPDRYRHWWIPIEEIAFDEDVQLPSGRTMAATVRHDGRLHVSLGGAELVLHVEDAPHLAGAINDQLDTDPHERDDTTVLTSTGDVEVGPGPGGGLLVRRVDPHARSASSAEANVSWRLSDDDAGEFADLLEHLADVRRPDMTSLHRVSPDLAWTLLSDGRIAPVLGETSSPEAIGLSADEARALADALAKLRKKKIPVTTGAKIGGLRALLRGRRSAEHTEVATLTAGPARVGWWSDGLVTAEISHPGGGSAEAQMTAAEVADTVAALREMAGRSDAMTKARRAGMVKLRLPPGPRDWSKHPWTHGWVWHGPTEVGTSVEHGEYGKGTIVSATDSHIEVRFPDGKTHTFAHAAGVERERAAGKPHANGHERRWAGKKVKTEEPLSEQGQVSQTSLVTFDDGTRVVRKRITVPPALAEKLGTSAEQADREVLAAVLARAVGLHAPAADKTADDEVRMDYVADATPGVHYSGADLTTSQHGRLMGLLDLAMNNTDRNQANWLVGKDGRLHPIDHGAAFSPPRADKGGTPLPMKFVTSPFSRALGMTEMGRWKDSDAVHPDDVQQLIDAVKGLREQFAAMHRTAWYDEMMARLSVMRTHAKGRRRVLEGAGRG